MNGYELSRNWFDWCFENPEKINPNHTAMYFFIIEHCNRLGWKEKFGLPTTMVMEAIGIKSYNTYIKTFNDLVLFGAIEIIEKSKNQYSSNIIALSNFDKAIDKALDKANIKHVTKQVKSIEQSNDSINKQLTINNETINNKQKKDSVIKSKKKDIVFPFNSEDFLNNWDEWKQYKKSEHSFSYKSESTELKTIESLFKDSNGNEKLAIEMINNAIAKNWKGIYKINDNNNGKQFTRLTANEQLEKRFAEIDQLHGINQEQDVSQTISERTIFDDYEEIP